MDRRQMNLRVMEVCAEPAQAEFASEIRYRLYSIGDREYLYDPVFALLDTLDAEDQDRRVVRACQALLIEFGFFRPMPQDEIDATVSSRPGPVWIFKRGGIAYTTDEYQSEWEDAAEAGWAEETA